MNLLLLVCLIFIATITGTRGIQGGEYVNGYEFNYQVSVQDFFGAHTCGGGIIDENHIITAAHCVSHRDPLRVKIVAGLLNLNLFDSHNIRNVRKIHIHEGYFENITLPEDATRYNQHCKFQINDIAVLTLYDPLVWGDAVGNLALPTTNFSPCIPAFFAGWTEFGPDEHYQLRLKWMRLTIFPPWVCRNNGGYHAADQFCTTVFLGGLRAIPGDSGGPLVIGRNQIVGIMSGVCENPNFYSFTNVYFYRDFITNIINSHFVIPD